MFYALSWLVVVLLLALWSLAVAAMHAVAVWTVTNAGALSGTVSGTGPQALPEWLAPWVSAEFGQAVVQLMAGLRPFVDGVLQALPSLAGGLTVVSWLVWGLGALVLLAMGAGVHLLIALWRRHSGRLAGLRRPTLVGS